MEWWVWLIVGAGTLWLIFRPRKPWWASAPVVFLDLETTGLGKSDEVVEIAIIDSDGNVLVNSLIRPQCRKRWPGAQQLHGIGPAHVADAPTLGALEPSITAALSGAQVVIYNADFDSRFLPELLQKAAIVHCCMKRYAKFKSDWNDYHNDYRWHKLTDAARQIGYRYESNAHRALADCRATRAVWQHLDAKKVQLVRSSAHS